MPKKKNKSTKQNNNIIQETLDNNSTCTQTSKKKNKKIKQKLNQLNKEIKEKIEKALQQTLFLHLRYNNINPITINPLELFSNNEINKEFDNLNKSGENLDEIINIIEELYELNKQFDTLNTEYGKFEANFKNIQHQLNNEIQFNEIETLVQSTQDAFNILNERINCLNSECFSIDKFHKVISFALQNNKELIYKILFHLMLENHNNDKHFTNLVSLYNCHRLIFELLENKLYTIRSDFSNNSPNQTESTIKHINNLIYTNHNIIYEKYKKGNLEKNILTTLYKEFTQYLDEVQTYNEFEEKYLNLILKQSLTKILDLPLVKFFNELKDFLYEELIIQINITEQDLIPLLSQIENIEKIKKDFQRIIATEILPQCNPKLNKGLTITEKFQKIFPLYEKDLSLLRCIKKYTSCKIIYKMLISTFIQLIFIYDRKSSQLNFIENITSIELVPNLIPHINKMLDENNLHLPIELGDIKNRIENKKLDTKVESPQITEALEKLEDLNLATK